jgi:hypothetical protein
MSSPHGWIQDVIASLRDPWGEEWSLPPRETAGVLFLIRCASESCSEPVLLLNRRSPWVKQPGDLCCPGGRVNPLLDRVLGCLLALPGSLLDRSRGWTTFRNRDAGIRRNLAMYWACSLRESWEEMRVRPWAVEFLGTLPLYKLRLFERRILPMVGWVPDSERFSPNWEVERIVPIPLSSLLSPERYATYLLRGVNHGDSSSAEEATPYGCFIHEDSHGREVLWGATYQIVLSFLERVYNFNPPAMEARPVVHGHLTPDYATGRRPPRGR